MAKKVVILGISLLLVSAILAYVFIKAGDRSKLAEASALPAIEVTENDRFVPDSGISLTNAKELVARYLAENGTKGDIPSSLRLEEITVKDAWTNNGMQIFRVELDYASLYGIAVVKGGKVLCVLDGMPTKSVFVADLDNDGYYEIYTNVYFGSGIVSLDIRGYNVATGTRYSLSKRMKRDLALFVQEHALWVKEYMPMKEGSEPISTGRLVLTNNGGKSELSIME